jgi:hypothetical protein
MARKKEGRGFFLGLLIVSGIAILFLYALFFKGKEITLFTFKWFVINKAFVQMLPREYTLEEAENIRGQVYDFYEQAEEGAVSDTAAMQVSQKIKRIMRDKKITDEEVLSLMALIAEKEEE